MIRVAHLTFSGAFGGREKVAFSLVKALSHSIYVSLYLVLENRSDQNRLNDLLKHFSDYDITTRTLETNAFFATAILKKLMFCVQEDNISVIHAHCHKSLSYALLLKYIYFPKLLVTCTLHGLKIPFNSKYLVHHLFNQLGLVVADGIIGCSREIVSGINRTPFMQKKISIIRNNLPVAEKHYEDKEALRDVFRQRHNIPENKKCWVGNASRLTAQKNIPLFLEAIAKFSAESKRNDVIFLLAGDGELKNELLAKAAILDLEDAFRFIGFLTNMDDFYRVLDLFLLTSDWEGTPMAVLEAMSHDLPVISSSVGGVPDIILDNSTGLLFPKGDLNACVSALHRLIETEDVREQMGLAAKQRILTEFTEDRWVREHLEHYKLLLSRNGIVQS